MSLKNSELILANARIVMADEVVLGNLVAKDGMIVEIDQSNAQVAGAINCEKRYVCPGLVELHTDNLERHMEPRPGVNWPLRAAVIAHDAELAGCGITTVFDSMRVGSIPGSGRHEEYARGLADVILELKAKEKLKASHFIHLRAEVCSSTLVEELTAFGSEDRVGIVSLMDHTPGQRQFRNMDKFKAYVTGKRNFNDDAFSRHVDMLSNLRATYGAEHEETACREAVRLGAVLASHDDTTREHVRQSAERDAAVAEFPTTIEAARACRENGLAIMMGAPNLIRGGSHSGNASARELAQEDLLDVMSSDYVPAALLQSAFKLADIWGDFPRAVRCVTANPANAVGLEDRGEIAIGHRADLIVFERDNDIGILDKAYSRGRRIF
ncbi:MAG: alpha-D-ribose 1-methylphosphonate 5-triphosphate diphosphatase [Roseovarius sp.]|nr:alpha-D-ribose 1-methylphosphonate 5-triphosphate diphosphatase [Roseovarius sp.]MCY4314619.1 alpha-D-ribose 1-methylphosphonate 5-triphosphate diphosphatase [Roseovarius sp.]